MSTEREKALEEALELIDRQFGKNAVMKLNRNKVKDEVAKPEPEDIVVNWTLSQSYNQPWEGQVTIGYRWEKSHNHVAINLKDLSKVIAKMQLQKRVAKYQAKLKNFEDFSVPLSTKK